jgi:exopolysaccharide biosynthesis protein
MCTKCLSKTLKAAALCVAAFSVLGCQNQNAASPPTEVQVVSGVVYRSDTVRKIQTLTTDLRAGSVIPIVVAENVTRIGNNFVGDAKSVSDWAQKYNAIGGLNAGFFGETYDLLGKRKQLVQLAIIDGKVVAPGSATASTARPGESYLRSAVGFTRSGIPEICWATGKTSSGARRSERAVSPESTALWPVTSAVACGPRLIHLGKISVSDRDERLVSHGALSRAFVAYDKTQRFLVMGRADGINFSELAVYLQKFFTETLHAKISEAMCLDGGPSAQLVYRAENNRLTNVEPTGVSVPTAILLVPNGRASEEKRPPTGR